MLLLPWEPCIGAELQHVNRPQIEHGYKTIDATVAIRPLRRTVGALIDRFMRAGCVRFARQPIRCINRLAQRQHRWHEWLLRPRLEGRDIRPFDLVCAAENARRATELDLLIHGRALSLLAVQPNCGTVNLNVSARTISHRAGVDQLLALVSTFCRPQQLVLEITETACLRNASEAVRFCKGLRELGGQVALDDVSNTHGAIELVNQDWIDIVKISIVNVRLSEIQRKFGAIVERAQTCGQRVIAEGVECQSQLDCVRSMGVRFVQGFIAGGAPQPMRPQESCESPLRTADSNVAHDGVAAD